MTRLQARAFTAGVFTPDHAETPAGPQPWKYQLEVSAIYPGGGGAAQNSTLTLWFTERLGGTVMYAGTADFGGVVFEVTQPMLDAIFALTYSEKQDPGPLPGDRPGQTPAGPQAGTVPAKDAAPPAETPKTEPPPKP
ncbi:MAG: hypothetical protein HYX71_08140 [Opitutae bacterium]|nr:hypothetical protein [Opitutae bacterium]